MADAAPLTLTIANKRGLHARAAAKFVRLVAQYDAAVKVTHAGQEVSGLSIMGLMMLSAALGAQIQVSASGRQASEALEAIGKLVESRFGED
ncbi:HPr family phosphocarrier protein [Vineibacter terrae]|uniref:HPr family phosphocarrier protein n=1 Tax=Vineibacter terrae TaxID=2586908 RepID=UPI002E321725|nr:HPr family phosphocarrier protein [Vineibacter terrae]HEX2885419.1 HPr family phosphocarrier protein [Vineibacter terrae]